MDVCITECKSVYVLSIDVLVLSSAEELCTLVITEAFPEDSGLFKCMAINSFGTVSCSAILEVYNGMMSIYTPVYPSQNNVIKMISQISVLTVFISRLILCCETPHPM